MEEHVQCKWEVCLCSSEAEVHDSSNVLKSELYRVWQTAQPTEEAWIILEAHPPSAFSELEIVNAGSALIEVFGLPDDCPPQNDDNGYMMLLSSQQLMSTKDVINKANRNRLFTYTCSDKLSRLAMQHRWRRIKVLCRQPFGSEEHKTSIGLSRLNFKSCKTLAEVAADAAEARVQQNLKADLAKMFPKGASNTGSEVVSPVTDSSRALEKQKSMKDVEKNIMASKPDNPPSSHGKRKLPPWQSFNKETKKVVDDEIMSHKPVLSEEEEEHPKDFKGKKVAPKISSPDRKEPPTPNDKKGLPGKEEKEAYTSSKKRTNTQQKHANVLLLDTLPQSRGDFKAHSGLDENSKMESSGSRSGSDPSKARNGSNSSGSKVIQSKQNVSPQVLKSESSSERQKQLVSRVAGKEGDTSGSDDQRGPMQSDEKLHGPKQDESNVPLFSKIMDGVTFVLSGFVNPERAELREKVMQMGGQYCPDWGDDCTLLICAFLNTPKFNQVKKQNGTIVSKAWIEECYRQKRLVDIKKYLMHAGKPWRQNETIKGKETEDECQGSSGHVSKKALASLQEVEKWINEDVASSVKWLRQQEVQPEEEELQSVAVQGILLCLDDTIECLRNKQSIKKIMDSWDYVPRAVRELVNREAQFGKTIKADFWSDMLSEAERVKWIYSKELQEIMPTKRQCTSQVFTEGEDDVTEDDASSEDTEVLDEDDIREAKKSLSKMIPSFT